MGFVTEKEIASERWVTTKCKEGEEERVMNGDKSRGRGRVSWEEEYVREGQTKNSDESLTYFGLHITD